jgi:hypothetical protein
MLIDGQVGQATVSDGTRVPPRLGRQTEVIVQELHGRYYEQVFRGNMFSAANQAAQAISVALATTYTGLLLYNPVGSPVNLVPNKVKFALSVAPAAIAPIGLIIGWAATGGVTVQTTPITPNNQIIGKARGIGIALSAATIVTPVWEMFLEDGFTAAALPAPTLPVDLEGSIILQPGAFMAFGALTAVTGLGSIFWEEVPING